jgi:peptide/nickel transport system substrate-binding protein
MEMERKNVAIIILAIALIGSGVGNIIFATQLGLIQVVPPTRGQDMVFGEAGNIPDLDPHYAYDSASIDVIEQVCEPLYTFNLSDEANGYPPVPNLASAMPVVSSNSLEYTIALKTGITFTDGTKFNASSVEYNFYRLMHFVNYSGNSWLPQNTSMWQQDLGFNRPLPATTSRSQIRVLYQASTGEPIINNLTIVDEYTIKIGLREPKASFLPILCFAGSTIMSPTYLQGLDDPDTETVNEAIDIYLDEIFGASIIGTGPFIFDTFVADVEVGFEPNPNYWQGAPKLSSLTFVQIEDDTTRNQALLSGDIDVLDAGILPAFLDQFEADPDIDLINGGGTLSTLWITFNYTIPKVVRQAISWCYNYSWVIDVIYERQSIRMLSPIPQGLQYWNYSYDCPTYDLAKARNFLLTTDPYMTTLSGLGITAGSPDSAWIAVATGGSPLESYNFTWNAETSRRGDVGLRLKYDMERIGMFLDVVSVAWRTLIDNQINERQNLELYTMGWNPDYTDPENYILPIWDEDINGGNYYEPDMHGPGGLYEQMLTETDIDLRGLIFQEIQQKFVERDFPGMLLLTSINWDAWNTAVKGYPTNSIGRKWCYPCYFA